MFKIIIILFISMIYQIQSYNSQSPIWISNPKFRSSNAVVINNNIYSAKIITQSFVYSSALTGRPQVAIGYKCHRGIFFIIYCNQAYDYYLSYQNFDLRVSSVTYTVLTVIFEMYNNMRVYRIDVSYFAIDPSLLYHINAFNGVHINYTSDPLTTFNTRQSYRITHSQIINYTNQATGLNFNKFSIPINQNKIAIYQNSMYITASSSYTAALITEYSILNQTHYQLKLSVDYYTNIYRYTFSLIIFNQGNIQSSKQFQVVYQFWSVYPNDYRQVKINFTNSFMLGLTQFQTYTTASSCVIQYLWVFQSNARTGIPHQVYLSTYYYSYALSYYAFSKVRSYLFYIKTWACNTAPFHYYNYTTNLCQDDCADYFIKNYSTRSCDLCHFYCQKCSAANSLNSCTACQNGTNRILNNGSCNCKDGFFQTYYDLTCRLCSTFDPYCQKCYHQWISTLNYENIFSFSTWRQDILSNFNCTKCRTNYFINSTSKMCETCTLPNCTVCLNLKVCSVCNATALTIKYTNNKCYVCNISQCLLCSANNICVKCPAGYDLISNQCIACNVGCTCGRYKLPKINGTCSTICGDGLKIANQQCDDSNNISHDGCSNLCKIEACNQSCSCDGWVSPWVNNSCSTRCGDGIKRGVEQCDDGNTKSNDGCSLACKNQTCQISCNCNGWGLPFNVQRNLCTPICGDGLIRGDEECDDNNKQNNDGCNSKCKIKRVYLKQQNTIFTSLILFFLSFRIVGIQVLNVIQHFQLLLKTYKIGTFEISYFIHGYSNSQNFLFQISQNNQLLQKFNYMFLAIILVLILLVLIQFAQFVLFSIKNKLFNQNDLNQNIPIKLNEQLQKHSYLQQIIAVNLQKTNNEITFQQNTIKTNKILSNNHQDIEQSKFQFFKKFIRQILFDIIINCINLFVFQVSNLVKNDHSNTILQPESIFIIIAMIVFIIAVLMFSYSQNIIFNQNQLKFNENKIINYWLIIIFQKITLSILLNYKQIQSFYGMIGVKLLTSLIILCNGIFVSTIQKIRNILVSLIHILLIIVFTLCHVSQFENIQQLNFIQNNAQYSYIILLISLLFIMIIFYIRQAVNQCSVDQRNKYQQQQQLTEQSKQSYSDSNQTQIINYNKNNKIKKKVQTESIQDYLNNNSDSNVSLISSNLNYQNNNNNTNRTIKKMKNNKQSGNNDEKNNKKKNNSNDQQKQKEDNQNQRQNQISDYDQNQNQVNNGYQNGQNNQRYKYQEQQRKQQQQSKQEYQYQQQKQQEQSQYQQQSNYSQKQKNKDQKINNKNTNRIKQSSYKNNNNINNNNISKPILKSFRRIKQIAKNKQNQKQNQNDLQFKITQYRNKKNQKKKKKKQTFQQ